MTHPREILSPACPDVIAASHSGRTNSYTESQASRLQGPPAASDASTRLSQKQGQARVMAMMKDLDRHFGALRPGASYE